jgi:outer membrane lipase/esterase
MNFGTGAMRATCIGVLSALLVACGGTSLKPFNPARIIVFGDEASVIVAGATPAGARKYTVNALDDAGQIDCSANPIWIQVLALNYGMSFPECPLPADTTTPAGVIRALAGATAGGSDDLDLTAQITRQLELSSGEGGGIVSSDLVTVYVGVNDVVAAFERYKAGASSAEAIAQAEAAGETLAAQVNRIANAGGKVITATVPDVGVTPYARALSDDGDRAFLTTLTERLNARYLVNVNNDGREIGLIEINPYVANVVYNPEAYGYLVQGVLEAACIPEDPLVCTGLTLKTDATAYNYLWADALQLTPAGHAQLGNLATSRAKNQPFQ